MCADPILPGPDTADLLTRMGRRRRARRRTVALSVAPAAVLAGLVAYGVPPSASTGLHPVTDPTSTPTATADPSPDGSAQPATAPAAAPTPDDTTPARDGDPAEPTPGQSEPVETPSRAELPDEPVTYTFQAGSDDAATCDEWLSGPPDPGPVDWCFAYPGATTAAAGTATELPVELCHGRLSTPEDVNPDKLHRWVTARIVPVDEDGNPTSGPAWRWDRSAPPGGGISFSGGDCARWTIDWNAVDDYGSALPAGRYRLYVTFPNVNRDVLSLPVDLTITG